LRERHDDIPILAHFFVNKFATAMNKPIKNISPEAMDFIINYKWPGNVRELENAIERAVVVGKNDKITVENLPFHVSSNNINPDSDDKSLAAVEKKYILQILNENKWNISRSAVQLNIDRVTLYNKISKYGLRNTVEV
jgi:DNA-binding NtrC family response regulator